MSIVEIKVMDLPEVKQFCDETEKAIAELTARAEKAEHERDAQHEQVLRLTGERDAVAKDLARIRAVSAIAGSVARWDSLLNEMHKQKAKVSELTATRDLLTAENARLQREHNAYVQRLSADALQVASKYQRERDEARAQVATLELLQRGGK